MKEAWMSNIAHIHAQDAALFAGFIFVVIGVGIWWGMREDKPVQRGTVRKEEKK